MEAFLTAACGPGVDAAKVRAYCEDSVGHFHWLVKHGVPFEHSYFPEHDREPPDTSGLVFSGGEDSWPFNELATPVPRGHHPAHADDHPAIGHHHDGARGDGLRYHEQGEGGAGQDFAQ